MAGSILHLLHKKQCRGVGVGSAREVVGCLNRRHVALSEIADSAGHILNGHVVLGFTGCGLHLISYLCEVTSAPPVAYYHYSLHWWRFQLHTPLHLVHSYELFNNERLNHELHLVVAQSADLQSMVILGCRRSVARDDQRPCHVTILVQRLGCRQWSVHFKFDLLPPFPSFSPSLSLRIPGCLILNTGDSLVCVDYLLLSLTNDDDVMTGDECSSPSHTIGLSSLHQHYAVMSPSLQPAMADFSTAVSPNNLLPIDVYYDGQPMVAVSADSASKSCLEIRQSRFDVEVWLNTTLQRELDYRGYSFFSLNDYDLQMVEVCAESRAVFFLLVVLVEAQKLAPPPSGCCHECLHSVEMICSWNSFTGKVTALNISQLTPISPLTLRSGWGVATRLALTIRKRCFIPMASHCTIRAFSNHTVYTGKSLQALTHPTLPLTLVLKQTRQQLMNYS